MTLLPFQLFYVFLIFSHEACSNLKTGENTLKKFFLKSNRLAMLCFKCFSKFRCSTAWHWNARPPKESMCWNLSRCLGAAQWLLLFRDPGFRTGQGLTPDVRSREHTGWTLLWVPQPRLLRKHPAARHLAGGELGAT